MVRFFFKKNHLELFLHAMVYYFCFPRYQYFLLDVILFLLAVVFVVGYILIALCR